ncbi:MAG: helix-turn-helix transcriptional regulator [Ruminococcaceae bacterium]|nr:helix-turn-helix transcriptional regulator [Oscillospiraceae bacterium]
MSMGKNIAYFRKRKGYTQEELGQKIGVTNQAVSKWELETSMPDIMILPRIANALDVTLDDLFAERIVQTSTPQCHVFNENAVHNFPKAAQAMIIDSLCHQTNLVNCNSWDVLKAAQNPSTKKYDQIRQFYTMCCLSDTEGAAFVSNTLTMIDSGIKPTDIGSIFEKPEVASGIKKLSDSNVRQVLSHICNEYFKSKAPFDYKDSEYFTIDIKPNELSRSIGISTDDILDALEKLISLHIVELETNNGTRYLLHKIKAIEAAVSFRLIERLIHNEAAFGCDDFFALAQY